MQESKKQNIRPDASQGPGCTSRLAGAEAGWKRLDAAQGNSLLIGVSAKPSPLPIGEMEEREGEHPRLPLRHYREPGQRRTHRRRSGSRPERGRRRPYRRRPGRHRPRSGHDRDCPPDRSGPGKPVQGPIARGKPGIQHDLEGSSGSGIETACFDGTPLDLGSRPAMRPCRPSK